MRVIEVVAKSIFTKTRLSRGKGYSVNQYVGCGHRCMYCYARYMCKWKEYGPWGTWIEVKVNAPELVKYTVPKGEVYMSTVSDAYQPLERRLQLTRRVLRNMSPKVRLSVLTKSTLILRDLDVFEKFEKVKLGLTVNGLPEALRRLFEPFAPPHAERVKALRRIKKAGFTTYVFVAPIIPGVMLPERVMEEVWDVADEIYIEILNTRLCGERFRELILKLFPKSLKVLEDPVARLEFHESLREKISPFASKVVRIIDREIEGPSV